MNEVDSIRLEQFRQIKKEIRGSSEYLIVGIDVAKYMNYAFYGTATGKTLLIILRMSLNNQIKFLMTKLLKYLRTCAHSVNCVGLTPFFYFVAQAQVKSVTLKFSKGSLSIWKQLSSVHSFSSTC